MKYIKNMLLVASLSAFAAVGCATHGTDLSDAPNLPPPSDTRQIDAKLPEQELKGLVAQAEFKSLYDPVEYTHGLDLRLTNRDGEPKRNVRVQQITLGGYFTHFTPPAPATLWHMGSSVDYPSVAYWTLPGSLRARMPLEVVVRYEDRFGKGAVALFRWKVTIEPSDPYAAKTAEPASAE